MDDFARETGLLTSPEAAGLLLAALGTPSLPGFAAELASLHYRPGSEVSAVYAVSYLDPSGAEVAEDLVATTAAVQGEVARVSGQGMDFAIWRHPHDPRLPALAAACDPAQVLRWCAEIDPRWANPTHLDLELLTYRPLRRAVIRAQVDGEALFAKVLRPGYDDRLRARQDLLATAGLTPAVLAHPAPGVVWTAAAPGSSLAQVIAAEGQVPPPESLIALLDALPQQVLDLPARPSWTETLDFHATTARQELPHHGGRIDALVRAIAAGLAPQGSHPVVATHGDFYEANLFVDPTGLQFIDVDSVGPGLRADDLACALAHLAVLPSLAPDSYPGVPALLLRWREVFEAAVEPTDLRARVAAVLVSLISGDPEQAETRLTLAEDWLKG